MTLDGTAHWVETLPFLIYAACVTAGLILALPSRVACAKSHWRRALNISIALMTIYVLAFSLVGIAVIGLLPYRVLPLTIALALILTRYHIRALGTRPPSTSYATFVVLSIFTGLYLTVLLQLPSLVP